MYNKVWIKAVIFREKVILKFVFFASWPHLQFINKSLLQAYKILKLLDFQFSVNSEDPLRKVLQAHEIL